jgi:branched-chain amino acid transport system substrate-binding protein
MKRRIFLSMFAALLCLSGAQITRAAEARATEESAVKEDIKVGITVSLTGDYADFGREEYQGAQMWVGDINARGGLLGRTVELVYYDDESDPETSARLYERLITKDKVDLLLGPYSSDLTLAACEVAERNYMDLPIHYMKEQGLTRIALVYAGTDFPQEIARGVREEAQTAGLEIVFDEEYAPDTTDFSALVNRLRASNPDAVIGGTYLNDSVAIVQQAKASRLSPKMFVFTVGPAVRDFGDDLGAADAEDVLGVVPWMRSSGMPQSRDFSYRYKRKYGYNAAHHAVYGYSGGQILEAAVRLAGTLDKDAVREQLGNMTFRSLFGHYKVNDTGEQTAKQIFVMQWKDGYRLLVLPDDLAESSIDYPFTPWSVR